MQENFRNCKKIRCNCSILRPKQLANNKTSTLKVIKHFINKKKILPKDNICCVYPATPLLTKNILKKSMRKFLNNKNNFLVPIQN